MYREKRLTKIAATAFLAVSLAFCGCADGTAKSEEPVTESISEDVSAGEETVEAGDTDTLLGRFYLYRFGTSEEHVEHDQLILYGLVTSYIEFFENGTGKVKIGEDTEDFAWETSGTIFIDHDGDTRFERHGDVVHLVYFDTIYTFARQGVVLSPEEIPPVTENLEYYADDTNIGNSTGFYVDEAGNVVGYDESAALYYQNSPFYERLAAIPSDSDFRNYVVAIALSQVGYHEGNSMEDLCGLNAAGDYDYTEYGRYTKSLGDYWGSEFVTWCVRMTGLPFRCLADSIVGSPAYYTEGTSAKYYKWEETTFGGGSYSPRKGDILLVRYDHNPYNQYDFQGQTALITHLSKNKKTVTLRVVQGNANDAVIESDYIFDLSNGYIKSDAYATDYVGELAYIIAPDYDAWGHFGELSFATNGGYMEPTSKYIFEGGLCGALPIPVRVGMTFDGWYTEPDGGEKYDMYKYIEESENMFITLYAHWK